MRAKTIVLLAAAAFGATALILVSGASAKTAPGVLVCPLPTYNPTHYALVVGTTVTCTITGATDVADGPVNVFIKSTPLGNTTIVGTAVNHVITFTFTAPANGCMTSVVAYGSLGNNAGGLGGFGYVTATGAHIDTCTGTVQPGANLTATKTAVGSFDQKYTWGITKDVDKTVVNESSGSATFNYTVTVTHDGGTNGNWKVSGAITVDNENTGDVTGVTVTDAIADATATCVVTGGTNATIPAVSSVDFPYTCTYPSAPSSMSELNTGTVTWGAQTVDGAPLAAGTATGTATVDWTTVVPTIVDGSVNVTDSLGGPLGTVSYTDPSPTTFTYPLTFTDPSGTCTKHDNTATFTTDTTQTTGSANQSVLHCVGADLKASKTATPAFTRTYKWTIAKSVDKTTVVQFGGTATFNYTVTVNSANPAFVDSAWVVSGTITVTNPNDWESITTNVTDAVNNGGVCTVTGGTGVVLAAGASATLPYSCTYAAAPSPLAGTNTATATWDGAAAFTPDSSATGTATFDFNTPPTTEVNKTVTVTDTFAGLLGTVTYGTDTLPKLFTYSRTIPIPLGGCLAYPNTATIVETGQNASQTVTVCGNLGALTMGFWQNKNGQKIISSGGLTAGVCNSGTWLRQFLPFQDLSATANCGTVASYVYNVIKAATCGGSTCNPMLKAQMLATALDVYFSDPALGGNQIGAPTAIGGINIDITSWSGAFGGSTCKTVSGMLTYAASQSNSGGSVWYAQVKATQVLAKSAFDAINNDEVSSC